jgi:protein TonB
MVISKNNLKYLFFTLSLVATSLCFCQDKQDENQKISEKNIAFAEIGQPPFPDECQHLGFDQAERKQCLSDYISKFISENFRTDKFKNPTPGRYRISVQFTISKKGKIINVMARGPHVAMEKEAIRVIKKLPRMNPGRFEGEYVNVLYGIPINLVVPEKKKK